MKRLLIIILLYLTTLPVICHSEEFRETMLNSGLRNSEPRAYQLIEKARENSPESGQLLKEAMKDSPDLPAVYFELAKKSFSPSSTGIFESVNYIIEGLYAYSRNFWWAFTFAGSVFFSLVISFVAAIVVIVAIRFPGDLQLFAHDMAEIKYPLLMLIALIFFSFVSPFLFLAGMLVILGMYMKKIDRPVVYIFLVFLALSPFVFKASSLFVNVMSSPRMKAIVEVNESKDNRRAATALKNSDDYASLFSYALALKREGNYVEAAALYQKLLQRWSDPKVYVNLGNCYVGMNNMSEAINYYLKAVEMNPLASGYYNLSQISRELLDYTKGNEYFSRALVINRNAVSDYRSIYSRNPNRIVVDETLSSPEIWKLALEKPVKASTFGLSVLPVFFISGTAMVLIILFALLNSRFRNKAYRCRRCSTILCQRCEKRLIWGQMCPECYASMIKLDALVAKERIARLLAIYEHQKKRRNIMKIFSFLMPGVSQIYAGNILYGFLFLWPFLFFLFLPVANVVFSGGGLLSGHIFFTWAAVFFAAGIYIFSNIITRQRIAKGWL
ncbi:MAG: tetratricopeptide repeat protein [Nitrospiraceae bacterium]|nr:MAG: tetratricopeptide repeat protein [Nitrospiraceae bacterium]